MKLSDIKGERTFDVIADIIDPIANIAEDKAAVALFERKKLPKGMTAKQFMVSRIRESVPELLRNHKTDLIAILSTIEGITPDEYEKSLNLVKIVKDCTELLTDDAFTTLFISAQTKEDGVSSGAAPETSQEEA